MKKLSITMLVLDILAILCFILFYAVKDFKYTIIATAMNTKTHQWIAYTFYSDEDINYVLAADSYIPLTDDVKLDEIVIDTKEKDSYDNEYDEQILTRDGNDDYKLLNIKIGNYTAYLVAIYDPSKVRLVHAAKFNAGGNPEANRLINMCGANGAKVCINGGMFVDYGNGSDIPMGYLIKDGKVIWSDHDGAGNLIGFNYDGKLMLVSATGEEAVKMGMRDALEFGPFLIVNGKTLQFTNSSVGGYSRAARVAIGQRKDGVVLFLVTDGTHAAGPNMGEITETMKKYGAYNAANLDGGTSSSLVINGKLINNPKNIYGQRVSLGRKIVSGFGLVP